MACSIFHLLLTIFVLPITTIAQSNGTVAIGSSLTANENSAPWLSSNADFAFGFYQLENKELFLVSIWYNRMPEKTPVWYADGDNPSPRGSQLELTTDRGLVLTDPTGQETLISDPIVGSVSYGVMMNTGNFVVLNTNSESLWESFDYPIDTILPSQIMETGGTLSSRRGELNFSRGRFQLNLLANGNLALRTINMPSEYRNEPYFSRGMDGSSSSRYQLIFNESASIYISGDNSSTTSFVFSNGERNPVTDFYHRATLNFDGVFTQYYRPRTLSSNQSWSVLWSIPNNICRRSFVAAGSGVCGYNRICRLNIDRRPDCQCPRAFTLIDPEDDYRGCVPNFVQSCDTELGTPEDLYDFDTVTNVDWPTSDYELLQPYNEDSCKRSCLNDCMCAVAIFIRGDQCWKKKLPLSNGRVDTSLNNRAFIKVKKRNSPPNNPNPPLQNRKNQETVIILVSAFLGSSVFVNFILVGVIFLGFFLIYHKKKKIVHKSERNLQYFTYKELVDATNGFNEELGRGSFGIVYKGAVEMGSTANSKKSLVAVKKLDRIIQGDDKEFKTEVNVIGQTHHRNLVKLLGFCDEGPHRLLVYELLSNGSLSTFLFGELKLSWIQRVQIAIGIARGLSYLHDECSDQIIHCDIKPQNILLDDYYNARISDFGLAKLLKMDQSETNTNIRGTKGYVAPEWFRNMPITVKTDVYSFGVLLLEIICCRRNVDMEVDEEKAILTYWVYDCYLEGTLDVLVENDTDAVSDMKRLKRLLMVAIWCIQEDPSLRPTMKKVVLMLEGIIEVTPPPRPSPFNTFMVESSM